MGQAASRITVIGGGLGGALLTTYLGRAGHEVELFERRSDPQAGQMVGGRSINLAISTRGLDALERVGLKDEVLRTAVPMRGRMIHGPKGDLHFQPYDKDPSRAIHSIGRGALNALTIAAARRMPNVRVRFDCRCTEVDLSRPAARIEDGRTDRTFESEGEVLIGVDGAFSAVRRSMQRLERFDYSQDYLAHGYKELCIPPADGGGHRMERNALHIWPRKRFMMIALPNHDGSFTCTLFFEFEGPMSFAALRDDGDVRRLFESQFPDAVLLMPTLLEDFRSNPVGSMVTVRCGPWHHEGRVALLGDAAHAVVPFYGQGANASFEDCVVLDECARQYAPDWRRVFDAYTALRKPHTDALADLAIGNFIEMRDHTGSRLFRMRKRVERGLHRVAPAWFTPLYTLVSFTRVPYGEALARARRQDATVASVLGAVGALAVLVVLRGVAGLGWLTSGVGAVAAVACVALLLLAGMVRARREARRTGVRLF